MIYCTLPWKRLAVARKATSTLITGAKQEPRVSIKDGQARGSEKELSDGDGPETLNSK